MVVAVFGLIDFFRRRALYNDMEKIKNMKLRFKEFFFTKL